MQPAAQLIKL